MARGLGALQRPQDTIGDLSADDGTGTGQIGFCLDTCHAFASEDLDGIVDRVKAITGRIDLVHCGNSGTSSAPAGTATPRSSPAQSTPPSCWTWSARPVPRPSQRPPIPPPTLPG
jgi:hypothetical protein